MKKSPSKSKNIFSDINFFFLNKPEIKTQITFDSEEHKINYTELILQRTGIGVDKYRMLNIHCIGIDVPSSYIFEELLKWNGDSRWWPNHIAKVNLQENRLEEIQISLFGRFKVPVLFRNSKPGFRLLRLFNLSAKTFQRTPTPFDGDNARYLLYDCSGGYPIGVFAMYVRSSIPERGEKEMSQLFMMVGFNFYGKESWSNWNFVNKTWEGIHNRVTNNVVNRFKQLCEWQFETFQKGSSS